AVVKVRKMSNANHAVSPSCHPVQFALDLVEVALRVVAIAIQFIPSTATTMRVKPPPSAPPSVGVGLVLVRSNAIGLGTRQEVFQGEIPVMHRGVLGCLSDHRRHNGIHIGIHIGTSTLPRWGPI